MAVEWNPETGSYEWNPDDDSGIPLGETPPWSPTTGLPLEPPPHSEWDPASNEGYGQWVPEPTTRVNSWDEPPSAPTPTPGAPPPAQQPSTPQPSRPNNQTGGGGSSYDWPQFTAPRFDPGAPFAAPPPFSYQEFSYDPFSYDPFQAPTLGDAESEPGYAFARREGIGALENAAAARGLLRSGGHLKDLTAWGNRFAEQNYANVYNRAGTTYDRNRGNAFGNWEANRGNAFGNWSANRENAADTYRTNYGVSRDVFDRGYGQKVDKYDRDYNASLAEFNPRFTAATLNFSDLYNRWAKQGDWLTNIATAGAGS